MKLTNPNAAQLELLSAMASIQTEDELNELKLALSHFFAAKAQKGIERLWDEGKLSQERLNELRQEHLRTPYKA